MRGLWLLFPFSYTGCVAQGQVVVKQLDLADLRTVRALAEDVAGSENRLDRLILNAGVMACPLSYTQQGFEIQMGTNHFGHFLLTSILLSKMKSQVSSPPPWPQENIIHR